MVIETIVTINNINTIKKDEKDNTVINVHYNSFHYFLIVLMLLIEIGRASCRERV